MGACTGELPPPPARRRAQLAKSPCTTFNCRLVEIPPGAKDRCESGALRLLLRFGERHLGLVVDAGLELHDHSSDLGVDAQLCGGLGVPVGGDLRLDFGEQRGSRRQRRPVRRPDRTGDRLVGQAGDGSGDQYVGRTGGQP
eukprot:SAG22_NODE_116_length_19306_cov_247.696517_2_plen_141_part_00